MNADEHRGLGPRVDPTRRPCATCGSTRRLRAGTGAPDRCPDCDWPVGMPLPPGQFCSICRRRHGPERTHACE